MEMCVKKVLPHMFDGVGSLLLVVGTRKNSRRSFGIVSAETPSPTSVFTNLKSHSEYIAKGN